MDSSTALFSVQGSPFAMGSPARSHYHPSPACLPSPQHQCTALSPARLLPSVPAIDLHGQHLPESTASSPPDLSFLHGPCCQGTALDSDSTDPFPESWPSTERSSSSTPKEAPVVRQTLGPLASAQDGESIIAKYIKRFRHGQPSNRSQRQVPPIHTAREFWWLEPAPPSDSTPPKGGARPDCAKLEEARQGWALASPLLHPMGVPSDTSPLESPDPDTYSLQERATQLLLRSESSLSSTIPVSSEGLHSTPPSSTPDSDHALPSPTHLSLPEPSPGPLPSAHRPPAHIPQCSSSTQPEDDILFQWRLRRKMEQASQASRSLPLLGWKSHLAWGRKTGDGAWMTRPGLGLLPGVAAWRSGDGTAFPAPAAQPEGRSVPEWAPGSSVLCQGIGHSLQVPFLSAEPAVGQNPIVVHVMGQLASVATPSSTPQPEGDGGGAAERWSSRGSRRAEGPAEQPSSRDSRQAAGPAEWPSSQDSRQAEGASEQPGSWDAWRAAGPAERPSSRDSRRAEGSAERPGSRDSRRAEGSSERPGSRDSRRAAGSAERPGSRDSRRAAGSAERPGSRDSRQAAGLVERPGSRDSRRAAGLVERPGSRDSRRAAGLVERPGSRDSRRAAGLVERPGSRDSRRAAGLVERPGSRDSWRAEGLTEWPSSRDYQRAAGASEWSSSQDSRWAVGQVEQPSSQDAQQGAWAVSVAHHILKETQRPSKSQLSQGRAALEPEATPSWRGKEESSIHSALGQVISERLFSPPASPHPTRAHQSGQGAVSPPEQGAAEDLPVPGSQHPQLLQLAAQLLEEAEESDGTEFEEDPLLEVLRGQREVLRSQLWAVDIAVSRLLTQGFTEPPGHPC